MTGGVMLKEDSSTSLQKAFENSIEDFLKQYTLGFYPTDPGEAESYHDLEVKLRSPDICPGCRVETRKGYYAGIRPPLTPPVEVPLIPKAEVEKTNKLLVQRSILTAGETMLDLPDIPFTLDPVEQAGIDGQPRLDVNLNINPAGIVFKNTEGRYACNLQIVVFYTDKKRKIIGNRWEKLESAFSPEDYYRAMKEGIPYKTTVSIITEGQMTKVIVYDEYSNRIGSKLAIPFIVEKLERAQKKGQPQLKPKLKINTAGFGFENPKGMPAYHLRIAAYYPDIEENIPDIDWKKLEGTMIKEDMFFWEYPIGSLLKQLFQLRPKERQSRSSSQ